MIDVFEVNDTKGELFVGETIWNTLKSDDNAEKYPNFKSATICWFAGDQNCSGKGYPDFVATNTKTLRLSYYDRVDIAIDLINKNDKHTNTDYSDQYKLIFVYFDDPDEIAHEFGPNSPETTNNIMEMDNVLGYFFN